MGDPPARPVGEAPTPGLELAAMHQLLAGRLPTPVAFYRDTDPDGPSPDRVTVAWGFQLGDGSVVTAPGDVPGRRLVWDTVEDAEKGLDAEVDVWDPDWFETSGNGPTRGSDTE